MILRPPRSTRTDTLFPYTTPSDLGCYVRHEYLLFGRGRPYRRDRIEGNFGKVAERLAIGQPGEPRRLGRSEEHTSELQSLMRISYAVFCLKKKRTKHYLFPIY